MPPILEKYRKGIKTKVLHALSLGVPVLSTPAGVFGLEKEGLPVFISEIGDFSDTLLELVNGEDRVEKMKERTIDYIEKNYSEKVMERWKRIINMGDA
ncbi:glycosyltransferase [Thermogymnomonas acidicola]|uniref:glycosyltransferase n=1 Tax=Thermogymnomonas acidicola TaxID=399579 RepID=UPI00094639AA|nr:glycosyltransferase [Thermogymnomonas acidicola]